MSYVQNIVEVLGGVRAMARMLSKSASTVQGWKDRGTIPDHEKPVVLAVAKANGFALTEADFFPRELPPSDQEAAA